MRAALIKFAIAGVLTCATVACVQLPTEKQGIVDLRPQISFKFQGESAAGARVLVDSLDVGALADFVDGKAALRVRPGTHTVEVRDAGRSLLNERVYLADGAARTFNLN